MKEKYDDLKVGDRVMLTDSALDYAGFRHYMNKVHIIERVFKDDSIVDGGCKYGLKSFGADPKDIKIVLTEENNPEYFL